MGSGMTRRVVLLLEQQSGVPAPTKADELPEK
jgi:hypothetical protein